MINAYASERQYLNKLWPIWQLLPEEYRGELVIHPSLDGIIPIAPGIRVANGPNQDGILMVASHQDSKWAKGKFIYIEHGAGQSYDDNQWYSNTSRPNMLASLVPGPYCAYKTRRANPNAAVIEIGAPHLAKIDRDPKVIAFAWHWRCATAIEANTAFDEYREVVPKVSNKYKTIGHAHPRIMGEMIPYYQEKGIEVVLNPEEVLSRAALLIADNTTLIYEAAALNIPVVLLNKSDWDRGKDYGLRFWDVIPGPQVDRPEDLLGTVEAMFEEDNWSEARRAVSHYVYGPSPFDRLPSAILELVNVVKEAHFEDLN